MQIVTTKQDLIEVFSEMTMKDRVTQSNLVGDLFQKFTKLEVLVSEGFKGIHQRQDTQNGRLSKHDEKIECMGKQIQALETSSGDVEKKWHSNWAIAGIALTVISSLVGVIYKIQYNKVEALSTQITNVSKQLTISSDNEKI